MRQGLGKAPVRGTQSFVGVMGAVWRRPSLMGLEIWWRWLVGVLVLSIGTTAFVSHGLNFVVDWTAVQSATVFQPVAAIQRLHGAIEPLWVYVLPMLRWWLPLSAGLWLVASALGRTRVLRRLDTTLQGRRWALLVLGSLRAAILWVVWVLWVLGVRWAAQVAITGPAGRGEEPSLVFFSALVICGSIALYVVWGVVSWPLQLAPLLAMRKDLGPMVSLRAALGAGAVRGKLIEINLVMNIVKIALIVLAMVFSASPLAFQTVATQGFFVVWWSIAVLLYLAASDYFHVVRAAAYLSLWDAYHG